MDRKDILAAARKSWCADGYRQMSLQSLARELGVTKPALYRHFPSKAALLSALEEDFFDSYALRLGGLDPADRERPLADRGSFERFFRAAVGYFVEEPERFGFFAAKILRLPDPAARMAEAIAARLGPLPRREARTELILSSFAFPTGLFAAELGHARPGRPADSAEARLSRALALALEGLGFRATAPIDYEGVEAGLEPPEPPEESGLLTAIVEAVAEAGPWEATMELVARKAGLSKSGLYAHFESREDMLNRMLVVELGGVAEAMLRASAARGPARERLYAAMAAMASYLLLRPGLLEVLDWIRVNGHDLRDAFPRSLVEGSAYLEEASRRGECGLLGGSLEMSLRWISFLVINALMQAKRGGKALERLRLLHRLIESGLAPELGGRFALEGGVGQATPLGKGGE